MFKYLKNKLKGAVSKFSKHADPDEAAEEEAPAEEEKEESAEKEPVEGKEAPQEESSEEKPDDKEQVQELVEGKEKAEEKGSVSEKKESTKPEESDKKEEKPSSEEESSDKLEAVEKDLNEDEEKLEGMKKPGFFGKIKEKITKKSLSDSEFEDLFFDLEVVLLENNVAVEVIEKIKQDLKSELVDTKVLRGKVKDIITETLRNSFKEILKSDETSFIDKVKAKKPFVISFVGINGTGKTTNLAKIANYLMKNGLTVALAASDTFRAAAIHQLEEHANNLDIKMIKHDYGSDAAAVAYDAVDYAKARGVDVVLIDTAGRQHSNTNLMDELKKLIRVVKPDMKLFVGDSLTGNDCVEQARKFNDAVGIDGSIISKVDVDEKGGASISVSYVTGKPILFIGKGQGYDDIEEFSEEKIIPQILPE
ncbi:MAG: signal recognition particle-docking protein FtsY [Nanobdellota archaeon]